MTICAFYKKKWLKDHVAVLILVLAHGWRNNTMMTYVEKYAFDGTKIEQ